MINYDNLWLSDAETSLTSFSAIFVDNEPRHSHQHPMVQRNRVEKRKMTGRHLKNDHRPCWNPCFYVPRFSRQQRRCTT